MSNFFNDFVKITEILTGEKIFKEPVAPESHQIDTTLKNVDDVVIDRPLNIKRIKSTEEDKIVHLSGNAKDRRKQLRSIKKENPDCQISLTAYYVEKTINGEKVQCEDANTPRTIVIIKNGNKA